MACILIVPNSLQLLNRPGMDERNPAPRFFGTEPFMIDCLKSLSTVKNNWLVHTSRISYFGGAGIRATLKIIVATSFLLYC